MPESRNPRLQFTDAESEETRLKEHTRKAERAADKAEPKTHKGKGRGKQPGTSQATGKKPMHLHFEETDQPAPASKLAHAVTAAPGQALALQMHRKIGETEEDNVGVESAHRLEETAEGGIYLAASRRHSQRLRQRRAGTITDQAQGKANVQFQKARQNDSANLSNPFSRWQQKQSIKKRYAAAKHTGLAAGTAARAADNAAGEAARETKKAGGFVWRHRRGFGIVVALFLMLSFLLNSLSSCSVLLEGAMSGLAGSTYPSRDADMLGAEAAYAQMEADLQHEIDHYERLHSGYDEYHFDLDEIKHDPYVLISILTAYHQGEWTLSEVRGTLTMLFARQYTLTEHVEVERRYRTETSRDPETGETVSKRIPYDYSICYVTLDNFDLSHLPVYIMGEDQLSIYAVYMATLGNRPDLFAGNPNASTRKDYLDYDVPPEALEDAVFAAMLKEAEKYLGYPYVWGGSSPSTSFDCSGYVSWVINHTGWNVGRLGAQGLCDICTPVSSANARPGDLVFFKGTYDTPEVSHVGIYVGDGMMIHCGNPISYASINTPYFQEHFYTFGRLP
ncbi:MAG: CD1108 family mobile element protein [Candidatus Limivicinus sp.]